MDTIRGVPALADTDPAALIGQYSRDLREYLYGDTGWTSVTSYEDGFAGNLQVRRVGAVVELRGGITAGSMPTQNTQVAVLPGGGIFLPAGSNARPAIYWTAAATDIGYVSAGGLVGVTNTTAITRTSCQMRGMWFAG